MNDTFSYKDLDEMVNSLYQDDDLQSIIDTWKETTEEN